MTTGIIDRFRTMPLRSGAVLTGHVVASLARNLVATARRDRAWRCSSASGRPRRRSSGSRVFGLVALWILAITYLFAAIGLAASTPEAASGYGFILLFLPYLSSAFVPVETMPEWLQWIAENQPITPDHRDDPRRCSWARRSATRVVGRRLVRRASSSGRVVWGAWLFRRKAGRR